MNDFQPEGTRYGNRENDEILASVKGLEYAMQTHATVEAIAVVCNSKLRLQVDLHCAVGYIDAEDAVFCRQGEARKEIAIITRVGKPVAFKILSLHREDGVWIAQLSRRAAQEECIQKYLNNCRPGDIIPAKVTHLENFGAFLDVGCGVPSLLSVDCISVSRISHPRDRLHPGMPVEVVVKHLDREAMKMDVSMKELLGTWEENAALFSVGQTVTGTIRSVESYGIFVELAPNLAGLAELKDPEEIEEIRAMIGQSAAVYIKSILPERMKIKLVLIDVGGREKKKTGLTYYLTRKDTPHLPCWKYSPDCCPRTIETHFQ